MVWNHREFSSLFHFSFKLFERNSSGNRSNILSDTVDKIFYHYKLVFAGMLMGLGLYSCYPCYDLLFNGNWTLVAPLYLPFADHETLSGYILQTATVIFVTMWQIIGSYIFSCRFLLYVDVSDGMVCMVVEDFRVFDCMCEKNDPTTTSKRRVFFRNILMELMDLAE